jgi:hypothetical protein
VTGAGDDVCNHPLEVRPSAPPEQNIGGINGMGNDRVSHRRFLAGVEPMRSGSNSNGSESAHKLALLSDISDERYSIYRRTTAAKG